MRCVSLWYFAPWSPRRSWRVCPQGGTATTQSVSHAYGAAGTYTVQLTVTDNQGATGTTSQSVTVQPPPTQPPQGTNAVTGNVFNVITFAPYDGWSIELTGTVNATVKT